MSDRTDDIAVALFGELFMADQLARNRISKALPRGMELSHFSVLNHLARISDERTPAQLARAFHVTRGAMTNTLNRSTRGARFFWDDEYVMACGELPLAPFAPGLLHRGIEQFFSSVEEAMTMVEEAYYEDESVH